MAEGKNALQEAREQLAEFVARRFPLVRERGLTDEDSLLDSGAIDSLGILDLVGFLEGELGVHVGDDELLPDNFESVSAIVRFVGRKLGIEAGDSG